MRRLDRASIDQIVEDLQDAGISALTIEFDLLEKLYQEKNWYGMSEYYKTLFTIGFTVDLRIVENHPHNAPAWITEPLLIPRVNQDTYQNFRQPMFFRKDFLESSSFYTVLCAFAHEYSHLFLFSRGHHLRNSEVATDIAAMLFGFWKLYKDNCTQIVSPQIFEYYLGKSFSLIPVVSRLRDIARHCMYKETYVSKSVSNARYGYLTYEEILYIAAKIEKSA